MQQAERIAHDLAQLIFITRVHDRDALRIAIRRGFAMMINATEHDYIAADPRVFTLDNRPADRRHVAIDRALDNHVTAESNRAFFYGTRDSDRLAHAKDGRV